MTNIGQRSLVVAEGLIPLDGHEVWHRVYGDMTSGRTPVACLHGGPAAASYYLRL